MTAVVAGRGHRDHMDNKSREQDTCTCLQHEELAHPSAHCPRLQQCDNALQIKNAVLDLLKHRSTTPVR